MLQRCQSTVMLTVSLMLLAVVFHRRGLNDPGTFWHTRVGEQILRNGLMTTDPFTFTFAGKTWIPQQWGGEILMALLHRVGGFDAMLWFFLCAFAFSFMLIFRRAMANGMGGPLAGVFTAMAIVAAGFHFYVRPHVFTIIFTVIVSLVLIDTDNRRRSLQHLIWLVPLHIVWTNIHGGMLGGVATLGLAVGGWIIAFLAARTSPIDSGRQAMLLVILVIACGLTMFINPIGFELQRTWFRLIGSATLAEYVPEHSPLNPSRGGDLAVVGFAVVYLFILAGAGRPKLLWLVPLAWLVLSITSIRNGPIFVACAAVIATDIWPHTIWYRKLLTGGDTLATPVQPLGPLPWKIPLLITVAGLFLPGWSRHDPHYVPTDLIPAVRNIPAGQRIYNDPNFGGFLIWYAPDSKIFMDDRFELCGDAFLREYVEETPFDRWQEQYGFRWAFVANGSLDAHPRWELVQKGRIASLYRLRSP